MNDKTIYIDRAITARGANIAVARKDGPCGVIIYEVAWLPEHRADDADVIRQLALLDLLVDCEGAEIDGKKYTKEWIDEQIRNL